MSTLVKLEPLSARTNWNYNNYFISRAGHLNVANPVEDDHSDQNSIKPSFDSNQMIVNTIEKDAILKKMYELASSINVEIKIKNL